MDLFQNMFGGLWSDNSMLLGLIFSIVAIVSAVVWCVMQVVNFFRIVGYWKYFTNLVFSVSSLLAVAFYGLPTIIKYFSWNVTSVGSLIAIVAVGITAFVFAYRYISDFPNLRNPREVYLSDVGFFTKEYTTEDGKEYTYYLCGRNEEGESEQHKISMRLYNKLTKRQKLRGSNFRIRIRYLPKTDTILLLETS